MCNAYDLLSLWIWQVHVDGPVPPDAACHSSAVLPIQGHRACLGVCKRQEAFIMCVVLRSAIGVCPTGHKVRGRLVRLECRATCLQRR